MPGKIGMTATQRVALLRNQAACLLWHGRIETTKGKAKELQPYVEKIITLAINSYEDTVEETVTVTNEKGKEVQQKIVKDGAKKLAARRAIMNKVDSLPEVKAPGESKKEFKVRTKNIKHPLIEKIFNEIAPKYAERAKELGQGGGYTRIYLNGQRKGDAAETAIIELV
ncbi:MAG: 50S ribosomal protein L17 [Clostridia bacterium]|nr:50S ribosomal protein L17 [Clostridia bacterium]MBR2968638.1 50S ribosomal protein L17 [Clostridia bacterium]